MAVTLDVPDGESSARRELIEKLDHVAARRHGDVMSTDPTWFTGQLLLALPGIGDPRFEHSVIAMISHDEEGAMGIGIDDPIEGMTVGAVLDQLARSAARSAGVSWRTGRAVAGLRPP